MIEFDYLYKGLCGLANAHKASAMAGHLGAAVAAGYFFGEDLSDLDDEVYRGVEQELERIIKTLYGFQTLSGQMEDTEKQKQAEKALLFLMA